MHHPAGRPLDFTPEENVRKPVNAAPLREIFQRLEFNKLIQQMGLDQAEAPKAEGTACTGPCALETVTSSARCRELLDQWQGQTVAVLALPDLSALAVAWGSTGRRPPSSGRRTCRSTRPFWPACWPRRSQAGDNIKDVMGRAWPGAGGQGFRL